MLLYISTLLSYFEAISYTSLLIDLDLNFVTRLFLEVVKPNYVKYSNSHGSGAALLLHGCSR